MHQSKDQSDELGFDNKVVSFSTEQNTLAMKFIKFELQKNRLFLVGLIPSGATTNEWAKGCRCAIAWDSVTDYIVFDSESQYVELLEKSEE